jgi:hypothetical protein
MRFLQFFFWPEWIYLGLNGKHFWILNLEEDPFALSIHAFYTKPSRRFVESLRGIDN